VDEQPTPPGRDLPAPYQDPWMLLGRDLRALLATARLRGWELARRNRQGDLAVPAFWPRELRAWFWPLTLALALAVLLALVALVPALLRGPSPTVPEPPPASGSPPRPPSESPAQSPAQSPSASPSEPPAAPPVAPPPPADLSPQEPPAAPEPLQDEPAAIDPLLVLLQPVDPRGLIGAVREQPARSCLQLRLSDRFAALAPALQEQQAEAWRVRALELGYERLELVDAAGRLLARTARVGSGMILLSSAAPAPDAP
jgi:hypothetical protein